MNEYGGYLPLELRPGNSYYKTSGNMTVKELNSGKAAIYYALIDSNVKKIYIPHYICQSVFLMAEKANIEVERYFIDSSFMPVNVTLKNDDEMILIVNYFGICYEKIKDLLSGYSKIIIDNTQAFFAPPILRQGIYNIYSCKKFIGVPDGGYLIAQNIRELALEQDYSSNHMDFCLQSIEYGTGYAYASKKENDIRFLTEIKYMSTITKRILDSVDYNYIKQCRLQNFHVLHQRLKEYNRLDFTGLDFIPHYYPLYLNKGIQKELVEKCVYTPVLWTELTTEDFKGTLEQDFSKNIVFLPLDQRYTPADMEEICRRVEEIQNA